MERVVKVSLVEFERFVVGTGSVVKELAAAELRGLVGGAMENKHRQSDERKVPLEPLVRADHRGYGACGLSLVGDERVVVHGLHHLGIAREVLVLEVQHVGVWCEVAYSLDDSECKVRSRHLEGETFANQSSEFGLVLEGVKTGHDTAGAVT